MNQQMIEPQQPIMQQQNNQAPLLDNRSKCGKIGDGIAHSCHSSTKGCVKSTITGSQMVVYGVVGCMMSTLSPIAGCIYCMSCSADRLCAMNNNIPLNQDNTLATDGLNAKALCCDIPVSSGAVCIGGIYELSFSPFIDCYKGYKAGYRGQNYTNTIKVCDLEKNIENNIILKTCVHNCYLFQQL